MITYAKTKKIIISFDKEPHIKFRFISPNTPKDEIMSIKLYPFVCMRDLEVIIVDLKKSKRYTFAIPKGYCYDAMTIPKLFWSILGLSKENNAGLVASLLHDYVVEHKSVIAFDRKLSSIMFRELCISGGMPLIKAYLISFCVDVWQKLACNWDN